MLRLIAIVLLHELIVISLCLAVATHEGFIKSFYALFIVAVFFAILFSLPQLEKKRRLPTDSNLEYCSVLRVMKYGIISGLAMSGLSFGFLRMLNMFARQNSGMYWIFGGIVIFGIALQIHAYSFDRALNHSIDEQIRLETVEEEPQYELVE